MKRDRSSRPCSRTRSSRSSRSCKRETVFWARRGVTLRGVRFDPSLASYLLDPSRHAHRLEDVARQELDGDLSEEDAVRGKGKKALTWDEVEVEPVAGYANERADFTFRLSELLTPRMHEGRVRAALLRGRAAAGRGAGHDGADRDQGRHRAARGALERGRHRAREAPRPVHRARRPRVQRVFAEAARNHLVR